MSNKKTYLVITPLFPSNSDYRGNYIYDQIKEIEKQTSFRIQIIKIVSLFSRETNYNYNGYNVLVFKILDLPFFIYPGLFNCINRKRILSFFKKQNISNVDVIHGHVTYPSSCLVNFISDKINARTIIQHHGIDVLQLNNGRMTILKSIQRNFLIRRGINELNKIDLNIGVSQRVLDEIRLYKGYQPKSEYVMYNGVDTTKFFPMQVKKDNAFVIGCIANFWKLKDHISLIKATHQLFLEGHDVKLRLIGSGQTFYKCYDYVKNQNLDNIISFEGEKKHYQLNLFYNEIDLFAMPSYYEALGCVYLESWATNTPFVAIIGQGIAELISPDKKKIFLADPKSPISLKKCINNIINNKETILFDNKYKIENIIRNFLEKLNYNDI